uniref:Transmembrane protein n=1 Tax=Acrobeloides nanus TaxID=290746 RepID=A0A914DWZ0_9BILA
MISKILWICVICGLTDSQYNNPYQYNNRQQQPQSQQNQPWQGQSWQIGNQQNRPTQTNQGQQQNQFYSQQQQQGGYNYNQYGQHQQYQSSGSSQKGILANPVRPRNAFSNNMGASLYFKINGYSNPGMTMPNSTTCVCPTGSCTFLQNVPYPCLVGLTVIMASSDQYVQYISPDFVPYNGSTGTLGYGNWNNDNTIQMATLPQSIDIFVHNLGVVIDKNSGNLIYFNYLTKVDTFIIDLRNNTPASSSQTPQQIRQTYTGQDVQSTLDFTFSLQCQSGFNGPLCDLNCPNSGGNNQVVVCTSTITGQQSVCNYTNSNNTIQVGNCQVCVNGVNNNNTCAGLVYQSNDESNKVSKAFKVWTIVLGVLLGLAVLFIILLLVMYVILRRQSDRQTSSYQRQPNYSAGYNQRAPNSMTNPLLSKNDEWPRTNPTTAMSRGAPITDMETTQGTEAPRNGHSHYSPRREAEV